MGGALIDIALSTALAENVINRLRRYALKSDIVTAAYAGKEWSLLLASNSLRPGMNTLPYVLRHKRQPLFVPLTPNKQRLLLMQDAVIVQPNDS